MAELAQQPLIIEARLGRLRPRRQRPRPQARALRPVPLHPPRAAGAVAPRLADWHADGEFVPGSDEDGGGRWQFDGRCRARAGRSRGTKSASPRRCTPFRHLGFFPDMAPVWDWMREQLAGGLDAPDASTCSAIPASARSRCSECGRGHPRRREQEIGRARRATTPRCRAWPTARSAGWSTTPPSSPRARCGAASAMTASSSIRPSSAAAPKARSGGSRRGLPPLIADCRRLLDADSRFLFLTVYAVRMSSLALAGLLAEHCADLPARSSTATSLCARRARMVWRQVACCRRPSSPGGRTPECRAPEPRAS